MRRLLFVVALATAAVGTARPASACPASETRVSPPPRDHLPTTGATITVERGAWPSAEVEERGPALWSPGDSVELRVVQKERDRVVMTPKRPLVDGARYMLVFTRTATGYGLNHPYAPVPGAVWVAGDAPVMRAPCAHACPYAGHGPSFLGRLWLFGLLPFGAGYLGVTALLGYRRSRQRRALDRIAD